MGDKRNKKRKNSGRIQCYTQLIRQVYRKKHTLIHELSTNCVLLLPNPQNIADVEK